VYPTGRAPLFRCIDNCFAYIDAMLRLRWTEFARPGEFCHWARCVVAAGPADPPHCHDFVEVFWVEAGQGGHRLNGRERPLAAGQLVFVRDRDMHAFIGPVTIVNVAFPAGRWRALLRRYRISDRDLRPTCILVPPERRALELAAAPFAAGERGPLATDRFLLNVLAVLRSPGRDADRAPATAAAAPPWLPEALRAVDTDPRHFQSTRAFARLAGRSPEHVARALRRHTGMTPTDVVNTARMRYAARCLQESSEKILDIAMSCGFESLGHFYRLFTEAHGQPPDRYRRRLQAITGRRRP
jgi:AraC family cel operon transcriptional repressor